MSYGFLESLETALNKPEHTIFCRYFLQARFETAVNTLTNTLQLNVNLGNKGVDNRGLI